MHWIRAAFVAMLTPAFAGAALAQPPAAPPQRPPRAWQVDWGQYYCSMIRRADPGRPFEAALVTTPGDGFMRLTLIPQGSASPPARISSVVLMPGGRSFATSSHYEERGDRRLVSITGLPYDFRDALAAASELQLWTGGEIRARIPVAGARVAVAAHRRCTAEVSREWGIDEAGLAALRKRASSTNHHGLSPNDYPTAALRTATQGRVIVRIAVSEAGRPTECATVATSGSRVIDTTTCQVILARARFSPALDAAGRPVAVRMTSTVTWSLPDG